MERLAAVGVAVPEAVADREAGRVVNRYDLDRTILVSGLVLVALGLAGIVVGLWVGA